MMTICSEEISLTHSICNISFVIVVFQSLVQKQTRVGYQVINYQLFESREYEGNFPPRSPPQYHFPLTTKQCAASMIPFCI